MYWISCKLLPTHSLPLHLCFQELTVSHNSPSLSTFLLEVMSRAVCCAFFQAGRPIFTIRQSGRTMLMASGKANKLSHCKAGYAFAAVITYYSRRRKCPSFFETKIWPQLSFLWPPLQRWEINSHNSLCCHNCLFDLHNTHQSKIKTSGTSSY